MLLTMMIMVAIASFIVEMMIAVNIPAWRQNARKYKWFNMVMSILLSFVLGIAFGAAGVIALGAAMISTVLSIPGYEYIYWNYDSPEAQRHGGNLMKHHAKKWASALKDLFKLIYKIIRIITFPIWGTAWLIEKYRSLRPSSPASA